MLLVGLEVEVVDGELKVVAVSSAASYEGDCRAALLLLG